MLDKIRVLLALVVMVAAVQVACCPPARLELQIQAVVAAVQVALV